MVAGVFERMSDVAEITHRVFATSIYERANCASMINFLRGLDGWDTAQVRGGDSDTGYHTAAMPDVRAASVMTSPEGAKILTDFDRKMEELIKPLVNRLCGVTLTEHAGTQVVRYKPGEHYITHADAGHDLDPRYFTVVCYLNDDFEGGCTSFPSLRYSVSPESGKAIIFPSQYLHCAEAVKRGEKFVLVTWINGPKPIAWI